MDALLETTEIVQVDRLLKAADEAVSKGDNAAALKLTSEALEIDSEHVEALHRRVACHLKEFDFLSAETDAERIIALKPNDPRGHVARGLILRHISHHREALSCFLRALEHGHSPPKEITSHIRQIYLTLNPATDELEPEADGEDYYAQLVDVGLSFLRAKQHLLALEVLQTAAALDGSAAVASGSDDAVRPRAVVMRVHLALGHAYSVLKHYDEALASYRRCRELASAGDERDDVEHVAKSLVNMASIYTETGDSHQSLLHYEMLLDLRQRALAADGGSVGAASVFSGAFLASLYMNASIAYKTVGNIERALHYAEAYSASVDAADEACGDPKKAVAEALTHRRHLGGLYQLAGLYGQAMRAYREYLRLSKASGSRAEAGYAYGCLGSLYGALHMWPLALVMHERHVTIAERCGQSATCLAAYEMYGDTLMRRGAHDAAAEAYARMARHCERDALAAATAWCKLGHSHYCLRHYQRALHYFETALRVAREEHVQARLDAQYGIACCLQAAMDAGELERGRRHFDDLIADVGRQVSAWRRLRHGGVGAGASQSRDLLARLNYCYDGAQLVLSKLGNDLECLLYAERWRRLAARCQNALAVGDGDGEGEGASVAAEQGADGRFAVDPASAEPLLRAVDEHASTVVYYSLLDEVLLIWLLSPDKGLARFYVRRPDDRTQSVSQQLAALLRQTFDCAAAAAGAGALNQYACDRRDIADVNRHDDVAIGPPIAAAGSQLQPPPAPASSESGSGGSSSTGGGGGSDDSTATTQARAFALEKMLYKLVLGPIDDIIQKLEVGSSLVIVPDKTLSLCPFPFLRDLRGERISDRYRITCVPGLFALDLLRHSDARRKMEADDAESLKLNSRIGGLYPYCSDAVKQKSGAASAVAERETNAATWRDAQPGRATNPRLLTRCRADDAALPRSHGGLGADVAGRAFVQQLPSDGCLLLRKRTAAEASFFSSCGDGADVQPPPPTSVGYDGRCRAVAAVPRPGKHAALAPPLPGSPRSIGRTLGIRHHSTLISRTSTGTDCVVSPLSVPRFYQASAQQRALVIGDPTLRGGSMLLRGKTWYAPETSPACRNELRAVSEVLKCDLVTRSEATRRRLLELLPRASMVHLATYMDLHDGLIAMAPDDCGSPLLLNPIEERHYLVSCEDIVNAGTGATLVVLSGGSASSVFKQLDRQQIGSSGVFRLATAFLSAGAQCVLMFPLSLPSEAMEQFFRKFYMQFTGGCHVSQAIHAALRATAGDGSGTMTDAIFPYLLVGKDAFIDTLDIKSAMLDMAIDEVEKAVEQVSPSPLLNLRSANAARDGKDIVDEMQAALKGVLELESSDCRVTAELISLAEAAEDAGHRKRASPCTLSVDVDREPVHRLLRLAGFDIEDVGLAAGDRRAVALPPHSDLDGFLGRLKQLVSAARDICKESPEVKSAIYDTLPRDQTTLSYLADVCAVTKHSPTVQLRVTDKAVQHLWSDNMCRTLLQRVGFAQIGPVLHFSRTPRSAILLDANLRLAVALCLHKTAELNDRMDAKQLGPPPASAETGVAGDKATRLPSLMPLLLAPEKVSTRVPWLSCPEMPEEMTEKLELSRKYSTNKRFHDAQKRQLHRLHESLATGLAKRSLDSVGVPKQKLDAVKVFPNSSASRERVQLGYSEPLSGRQLNRKRELSMAVLKKRLEDTDRREKRGLVALTRPYCDVAEW